MNNFLNSLVKLFGFLDSGLISFVYVIYLKTTKKLSYVEEKTISPENKEQFIKVRSLCFFLYFIVAVSLLINLNFTAFNRMYVWVIHLVFILCIFIYRVIKEGKYYQ